MANDNRTESALEILKDLRNIREKSEHSNYNFLTYLLQMAILECEALACGNHDLKRDD